MSLVTRCPACTTTFKVVRDQLRISDGWVRCGRCSEVFDATLDLTDTESGEPVPPHPFTSPKPPPLADSVAGPMPSLDLGDHAAAPAQARTPVNPFEALQSDLQRFGEDERAQAPSPAEVAPPPTAWPAAGLLDLPEAPPPAPALPSSKADSEPEASAPAVPAWRRIQAPAAPAPVAGVMADEPWPMRRASAPQDAAPPASTSAIDAAVDAQLQKALRRARVQALREERERRPAADAPLPAPAAPAPAIPVAEQEALASSSASVLRRASTDSATAVVEEAPAPADSLLDSTMYAADFLLPTSDAQADTPVARRHRAGLWALLAALAGVLLVAQLLRHERDPWAASQPALRPAIEALCQVTGCVVSAPRRIDAVRIDGSSFTPSRQGERYELMFTLRNATPTPVAMPSIELSLLDGNERPVVRRVFHPADFGAPAQMGPRGEQMAQLNLELRVPPEQRALAVMGYSMLAFYP